MQRKGETGADGVHVDFSARLYREFGLFLSRWDLQRAAGMLQSSSMAGARFFRIDRNLLE